MYFKSQLQSGRCPPNTNRWPDAVLMLVHRLLLLRHLNWLVQITSYSFVYWEGRFTCQSGPTYCRGAFLCRFSIIIMIICSQILSSDSNWTICQAELRVLNWTWIPKKNGHQAQINTSSHIYIWLRRWVTLSHFSINFIWPESVVK